MNKQVLSVHLCRSLSSFVIVLINCNCWCDDIAEASPDPPIITGTESVSSSEIRVFWRAPPVPLICFSIHYTPANGRSILNNSCTSYNMLNYAEFHGIVWSFIDRPGNPLYIPWFSFRLRWDSWEHVLVRTKVSVKSPAWNLHVHRN